MDRCRDFCHYQIKFGVFHCKPGGITQSLFLFDQQLSWYTADGFLLSFVGIHDRIDEIDALF